MGYKARWNTPIPVLPHINYVIWLLPLCYNEALNLIYTFFRNL